MDAGHWAGFRPRGPDQNAESTKPDLRKGEQNAQAVPFDKCPFRDFETNPNSQVVMTTFSSGSPRTKRSMFRATSAERRSIVPSVRGEQ